MSSRRSARRLHGQNPSNAAATDNSSAMGTARPAIPHNVPAWAQFLFDEMRSNNQSVRDEMQSIRDEMRSSNQSIRDDMHSINPHFSPDQYIQLFDEERVSGRLVDHVSLAKQSLRANAHRHKNLAPVLVIPWHGMAQELDDLIKPLLTHPGASQLRIERGLDPRARLMDFAPCIFNKRSMVRWVSAVRTEPARKLLQSLARLPPTTPDQAEALSHLPPYLQFSAECNIAQDWHNHLRKLHGLPHRPELQQDESSTVKSRQLEADDDDIELSEIVTQSSSPSQPRSSKSLILSQFPNPHRADILAHSTFGQQFSLLPIEIKVPSTFNKATVSKVLGANQQTLKRVGDALGTRFADNGGIPLRDIKTVPSSGNLDDDDSNVLACLCQAYTCMVQSGASYGVITSGEVMVLLKILWNTNGEQQPWSSLFYGFLNDDGAIQPAATHPESQGATLAAGGRSRTTHIDYLLAMLMASHKAGVASIEMIDEVQQSLVREMDAYCDSPKQPSSSPPASPPSDAQQLRPTTRSSAPSTGRGETTDRVTTVNDPSDVAVPLCPEALRQSETEANPQPTERLPLHLRLPPGCELTKADIDRFKVQIAREKAERKRNLTYYPFSILQRERARRIINKLRAKGRDVPAYLEAMLMPYPLVMGPYPTSIVRTFGDRPRRSSAASDATIKPDPAT